MAKCLVVPNIIDSVSPFFRLRQGSFSLKHSDNKFKSSDKCDSVISMFPATYNMVSKAYLMMHKFLRTSTIPFAKIINNKGAKMDPCAMPQVSKSDSNKVLF